MTEPPAYQTIRRQMVPHNPYFQQSLLESRRQLGIPELGFDEAHRQLLEDVPVHPVGFRTGKPDLQKLRQMAIDLGLPLEDWLARHEEHHQQLGRNFYDEIEQHGWAVLPIGGSIFLEIWLAQERVGVGLGAETPYLPPGSPLDSRLPSVQASMALADQYRLGRDFVPSVASMILGCPPGGGDTDISINGLEDGRGLEVTIHCVPYDCTKAEWEGIFHDVIQPALLQSAGKLPQGIPRQEAIEQARKRSRPGRPPLSPETLTKHRKMWEFCRQRDLLNVGVTEGDFGLFLDGLPYDERTKYEDFNLDSFRRAVKSLDRLMRPT